MRAIAIIMTSINNASIIEKVMTAAQNLTCALARPYISRELPGWGGIYSLLVGSYNRDSFWARAKPRTVLGKLHGYEMTLDLQRWSERATYFLGRFYDLPTQLLMQQFLRSGDRFCDVGANIGMLTLLASRLVGECGAVDAFEPNPACCERLSGFLVSNRIQNVQLNRVALADQPGRLALSLKSVNSGESTLTTTHDEIGFDSEVMVDVVTGDSLLADGNIAPVLLKLDVEGFECHAIAGLERTLLRFRPVVVAEVVSAHLARAGKRVEDLFNTFESFGYRGYSLGLRRAGFRHALHLPACSASSTFENNVLWVPDTGVAGDRARELLPLE